MWWEICILHTPILRQFLEDVYFGDESHFGLTPNLPYAWHHKEKPLLLPATRSKLLSVLGLMTTCCKLYSKTFEQTINSDIAIEFMDDFAKCTR